MGPWDRATTSRVLDYTSRHMRFARELTAIVGLPFTIWVIGWADVRIYNVTLAVIAGLALYEFLSLGRKKGYEIPIPLCIVLMLFTIAAFVVENLSVELGMFATLLVIPASYVFSRRSIEESLPSSAIAVLATMYIGMLGGSMIRLHNDFPVGPKLVFFLMAVVWAGDAGAYYVGKNLGRTKLSPLISPKKTVEGGVGGVVSSIIVAVIIHYTFFPEFPLVHAIIAGAILSMTGVIGDLAESMWKRSAAVKDSGTLIPGHGGFLDRFDSIFFTAPILYVYWTLIVNGFQSLNIMTG